VGPQQARSDEARPFDGSAAPPKDGAIAGVIAAAVAARKSRRRMRPEPLFSVARLQDKQKVVSPNKSKAYRAADVNRIAIDELWGHRQK